MWSFAVQTSKVPPALLPSARRGSPPFSAWAPRSLTPNPLVSSTPGLEHRRCLRFFSSFSRSCSLLTFPILMLWLQCLIELRLLYVNLTSTSSRVHSVDSGLPQHIAIFFFVHLPSSLCRPTCLEPEQLTLAPEDTALRRSFAHHYECP